MNDLAHMHDQLTRYFAAEKTESLVFVLVGLLALGAGGYLLATGSPFRAMGLPLGLVALIQLGVGGAVYLRTGPQVSALATQLRDAPEAFRAQETARMAKVRAGFRVYKAIEVALLVAGIALACAVRQRGGYYAVGVGLVVQSALMLTLDLFAERRADAYAEHVARFVAE